MWNEKRWDSQGIPRGGKTQKADAVPAALTSDPTHDGAVLHDVDGDVVVVHARSARVDAGEFVEGVAPVVVVGLVHTRAAAAVPAIVVCQ